MEGEKEMGGTEKERAGRNRILGHNNQKNSLYIMLCQ